MIIIVELIRCVANTHIFNVIVYKFHYMQIPGSIILLLVNESVEIGFYYTILPLNLAICLKMKS